MHVVSVTESATERPLTVDDASELHLYICTRDAVALVGYFLLPDHHHHDDPNAA